MTINNPQVKRRDLLKAGVAASAAMTVGIPLRGLITDKIIEPRLGQWQGNSDEKLQTLTESQRFGLRIAGVVSLLFIAAIALMVIPQNGILRDPINHTVMPSPFIKGIVPLIILFFFVVSLAYGKPFNMKILLRRIEVALRRGKEKPSVPAGRWSDGFLLLDFSSLTAGTKI